MEEILKVHISVRKAQGKEIQHQINSETQNSCNKALPSRKSDLLAKLNPASQQGTSNIQFLGVFPFELSDLPPRRDDRS